MNWYLMSIVFLMSSGQVSEGKFGCLEEQYFSHFSVPSACCASSSPVSAAIPREVLCIYIYIHLCSRSPKGVPGCVDVASFPSRGMALEIFTKRPELS